MDKLTFIESIISSLAWPICFLIVIILFRNYIEGIISEIRNKLGLTTKAKYKDLEFLFSAEEKLKEINTEKLNIKSENEQESKESNKYEELMKNIELQFVGCHIASLLFRFSKSILPNNVIPDMHKTIAKILEDSIQLIKKYNPESKNMPYFEEIILMHNKKQLSI